MATSVGRAVALVEKVASHRVAPSELTRQSRRNRSVAGVEPVRNGALRQRGTDAEKVLRARARRLGVDVERFHAARLVENRVSEMISHGPERTKRIAKRLGISRSELKDLRRAFAGDRVDSVARTRAVVRRIAALGRVSPSSPRR